MGEIWRRLQVLFRGKRFNDDLAEEMRLHLELRAAEAGEATAHRRFGNEVLLRETSRAMWGWSLLESVLQDLRYGFRSLWAHRAFTAVCVLSLALGIGANTAIFSILNAVMLRSLPVEDPGRLVSLESGEMGSTGWYTNPLWEQIRDRAPGFSGMLAFSPDRFDLSSGGVSQPATGMWVSGDFFRVLGVPAMRGRVFTTHDDRRGGGAAGPVAVISDQFWKVHFAGDPQIVGKTVRLDRHPFTIVGVTPPWFRGLDADRSYDVAIPIGCDPILHADGSWLNERSTWWLRIVGRLAPGISAAAAQQGLNVAAPGIHAAAVPADFTPLEQKKFLQRRFELRPAKTGFSDTGHVYRTALFTLMAVVAVVLMIACANIANLLLARASARQREISVRLAMGASRGRVIRQLLTESLLLSLIGGASGLLFATWGSRFLVRLLSPQGSQLQLDVAPDLNLLGFTMAVALLTGMLFGLVPAWRATRLSPNHVLKEHARGTIAGSSRSNLGKVLVTGQVALSLLLVAGAGLFLQTMRNLLNVDTGFDQHNVLLVQADVMQTSLSKEKRARAYQEMLAKLRSIPGVVSASSSSFTPLSHSQWDQHVYPMGREPESPEQSHLYLNRVSPGYFRTMKTPLLLGRDFTASDTLAAPRVIILGESTARVFFGNVNPIGKMVGVVRPDSTQFKEPYRVIGVVKDTRYESIDEERSVFKTGFFADGQDAEPWPQVHFEIRSAVPIESLQHSVRSAIESLNRDIALEFRSFEGQVDDSLAQPRVVALLSSFFGGLALMLSMIGLYGVTAYSVARRQGEIGIRIALGARQGSVLWLVLRDVLVMLASGAVVGLIASALAGSLVKKLLFGVQPADPGPLAMATALLVVSTAIAAYLPARRAARLDPMAALREE